MLLWLVLVAGCNCGSTPPAIPSDDGGTAGGGADSGVPWADGGNGGAQDGGLVCPAYQRLCDGGCVLAAVDPENCGGCEVRCTGTQACSSGTCSGSCLGGLSVCANRCVDFETDNAHCGSCARACAPGTGCVGGACLPVLDGGSGPATCPAGGPALISVPDAGVTCAGTLAQTTFRWALCSCGDVTLSAGLKTDGYDSAAGAYTPGGGGAGVGLNGQYSTSSTTEVGGSLWASSSQGVTFNARTDIQQELHSGGPLRNTAVCTIGGDAFVNGEVIAGSSLTIGGTLHLPGAEPLGQITTAATVTEPVSVAPPCDCGAGDIVPVGAIVEARRTQNDNATIGLSADLLASPGAPTRLDLPCGHYYLSGIGTSTPTAIVAHGRTVLYVGGDIRTNASLVITLDPSAELDVFVAGEISGSAPLSIGSPNAPALTRVYLGGTGAVSLSAQFRLSGFLYAARAPVNASGTLEVFGGLYPGSFSSAGGATIHYDQRVLAIGSSCPAPSGTCLSCQDCGNQACVNGSCQACTSSAQCCAPLQCFNGRCEAELQ